MNNTINVSGTHTAIVTPFRNNQIDYNALSNLIETQVTGRVNSIVVAGTTGESPTLTQEEHIELIRKTVEFTKNRILVIAGTGSNSTSEAIHYTKEAEAAGADGALIVAPYYNKPTQEGVFRHFREIANNTNLPIILYSIPGRCGIGIETETVVRLARECSNIIAIKEASGRVEKVRELRTALDENGFNDFQILSGDDGLTLDFIEAGASGVVSVASNLLPAEIREMVDLMNNGNTSQAREMEGKYEQLFRDLFIETNPTPTKESLAAINPEIYTSDVRLPLCELLEQNRVKLLTTLRSVGLIV